MAPYPAFRAVSTWNNARFSRRDRSLRTGCEYRRPPYLVPDSCVPEECGSSTDFRKGGSCFRTSLLDNRLARITGKGMSY
jgi:hypothetical protein